MRAILWFKEKILHILPIFLFFLVFFTLINWIEAFLFEKHGLTPIRFFEVVVAAALIAKIVLVVDLLPAVHRYKTRPLIYPILWKTAFYWVILLIVRLAIHLAPNIMYRSGYKDFMVNINWDLFISNQAYYLMLLFIFVTFQEITYRLGPKKMRQMFFGF